MTGIEVPLKDFEAFGKALRRLKPEDRTWLLGLSIELAGNAVKRLAMRRFNDDDRSASAARTVFQKLKQHPALRGLITGA